MRSVFVTPDIECSASTAASKADCALSVSRSPRCSLRSARPSTTRVTALFRAPPRASPGPSAGRRATNRGASPRARWIITGPDAVSRTTESSTRRSIGRSGAVRNASPSESSRTRARAIICGCAPPSAGVRPERSALCRRADAPPPNETIWPKADPLNDPADGDAARNGPFFFPVFDDYAGGTFFRMEPAFSASGPLSVRHGGRHLGRHRRHASGPLADSGAATMQPRP